MKIYLSKKEYLAVSDARDQINCLLEACSEKESANELAVINEQLAKIMTKYKSAKKTNIDLDD